MVLARHDLGAGLQELETLEGGALPPRGLRALERLVWERRGVNCGGPESVAGCRPGAHRRQTRGSFAKVHSEPSELRTWTMPGVTGADLRKNAGADDPEPAHGAKCLARAA